MVGRLGAHLAHAQPAANYIVGEGLRNRDVRVRSSDGDGLGHSRVEVSLARSRFANLIGAVGEGVGLGRSTAVGIGHEVRHHVAWREARTAHHHVMLRTVDHLEHHAGKRGVALRRARLRVVLIDRDAAPLHLFGNLRSHVCRDLLRRAARGNRDNMHRRPRSLVRRARGTLGKVTRRSAELLDRQRAQRQYRLSRGRLEKSITRYQVLGVHEHLALLVGGEDPGAGWRTRDGTLRIGKVAHEELRAGKRRVSLRHALARVGVALHEEQRDGLILRLLRHA